MAEGTDEIWPVLEAVATDLAHEQQIPLAFTRLSMPAWRSAIGPWTCTSTALLQLVLSEEYWHAVHLDPLVLTKLRNKAIAMYSPTDSESSVFSDVSVNDAAECAPYVRPSTAKAAKAPAKRKPGQPSKATLAALAASSSASVPPSNGTRIAPSLVSPPQFDTPSPPSNSSSVNSTRPTSSGTSPSMPASASTRAATAPRAEKLTMASEPSKPRKRVRGDDRSSTSAANGKRDDNVPDGDIKSTLMGAIESIDVKTVRKLLPQLSTSQKEEALQVAVQEYDAPDGIEMINVLLDSGVPIDAMDSRGRTLLNLAICRQCSETAAHLIARGADYNLGQNSYFGDTALHTAALYDDRHTLRLLLSYGMDPSVRNGSGQTPTQRLKEWKLKFPDVQEILKVATTYRSMPLSRLSSWDIPARSARAIVCSYPLPLHGCPEMLIVCAGSRVDTSTLLPDSHPLAPLRRHLFTAKRVTTEGVLVKEMILWSDDEVAAILLGDTKSSYAPLHLEADSYEEGRLDMVRRVLDAAAEEEDLIWQKGRTDLSGTMRHSSLKEMAYGEIKFRGIILLSTLIQDPEFDHFFDLGSGRGLAVFLIAALTGCRATGIEMEPGRHAFAERVLRRLPELHKKVRLECGDFLASSTDLSPATVVYVNNHNMEFIESQLCVKLLELANGARVAAVDPLPRDQEHWELLPGGLRTTGAEGEFYSYGKRLERYARTARIDMPVLVRQAGRTVSSPRKPWRTCKQS